MSSTQTPTRRLVRRTDDRVVAGVAGGLADYLRVDPVLVRIGFVVLAFAGGSGVIAYLALWLLTPEVEGGATPVTGVGDRGPAFWVAIGLFVLAGLVIADAVAERSVLWPLVLIGAGVALWRSDGARTTSATAPVTAADADAPTWTPPPPPGPGGTAGAAAGDAAQPWPPADTGGAGWPPQHDLGGADWTPPPAPPRDRSILGRLTMGLALLAVGVLAVLDAVDVLEVTVRDGFAVALLVVGLGLVVGTWVGRARWLAFPALLFLLPGLLLSTVVHDLDVPFGAGIGERSVGTTAPADVADSYELGIGKLTVDLSGLELQAPGRDVSRVETAARVGIGEVTVVVPEDVTVELHWEVAAGQADVFGARRSGNRVEGTEVFPGEDGAGTLALDVRAALGQVSVERGSASTGEPVPPQDTFDGIRFGPAERR